jgi:hypothetical protein
VGSKTVIKAENLEVKLTPGAGRMELTFGECTLDVGDEPSKERRDESSASNSAASQAPRASERAVAKSDEVAEAKDGKAADEADAKGKDKDKRTDAKSKDDKVEAKDIASSLGLAMSRPPPAKKNGASDSIPPGP